MRYPAINDHHYSSLRNALRLLNLFSVDEPELQLQDIATRLEIGQSTALSFSSYINRRRFCCERSIC